MERHEIRYLLEHRLLPHWFFEQKMQLIGLLLRDQEVLYRIIGDLFEKEGIENPYTADQFAVTVSKPDDKMVVRISFPEPEEEPLCYCSYLFFDETFEKVSYFCIEKGDEENGDFRLYAPGRRRARTSITGTVHWKTGVIICAVSSCI